MNASPRRERTLSRAKKELSEGANPFWMTLVVILNMLIFVGFGYMLWEDMNWGVE